MAVQSTPRKVIGCLVAASVVATACVILPVLLWMHTSLNLKVIGVLLHRDGYSRATYELVEYAHWTDGAGEFMRSSTYLRGTIDGRSEPMSVTFARYSPVLADIMETFPDGTPLQRSIDVWYNPNVRGSWLAREQAILPYVPDLFPSFRRHLAIYGLLWLLFIGVWLTIVLVARSGVAALPATRELLPKVRQPRGRFGSRRRRR